MTDEERIEKLEEALMDCAAHLIAATSAYEKYAKRHSSVGKSETDPFYSTRIEDFRKASERSRVSCQTLVER